MTELNGLFGRVSLPGIHARTKRYEYRDHRDANYGEVACIHTATTPVKKNRREGESGAFYPIGEKALSTSFVCACQPHAS